jgi:hypothetical protein
VSVPLRLCLIVFWCSLAVWLSALVTAGISATMVFGRLPETPMTLERYPAYPVEEHGRVAAGEVMADIFFAVDVVQFIVVPLTLITLGLQLTVFGFPARRPANVVRGACLLLATLLFGWYAIRLAPALNGELRLFWTAAQAGDVAAAEAHREAFAGDHATSSLILKVNLLLVLLGIAASAVAAPPGGGRRTELDTPLLATNP